jgi:nucleotide-binding universal stress UspA family protein
MRWMSAGSASRVAVAVGDAGYLEQLMRTALDLARERDGTVCVLSVVSKPRASPASVYTDAAIRREFSDQRRALLDRAVAMGADASIPVEGRLVVADSVAAGIVRGVTDCEAAAVLLGWHARRRRDIVMGHTVDEVVADVPCDVLVEKIGPTADGVEAVLLPAGEDAHTDLAAAASRAVARANGARVDVLRVVGPDAGTEERRRARELVEEVAAELGGVEATTAVVEGEDVVGTLVGAAEKRDVTVIGGGRGGWLRRFVVGSVAREVGRRARATVIVATRTPRVRSRLARLLA